MKFLKGGNVEKNIDTDEIDWSFEIKKKLH